MKVAGTFNVFDSGDSEREILTIHVECNGRSKILPRHVSK